MSKTYSQDPDYVRGAGKYEGMLEEQGVPKDAWGNYGNSMNPNEYEKILTGFKSTTDPYSASNVEQSTTNPVQQPDYSDPLNMRGRIQDELGIPQLKEELTGIKDKLTGFDQDTRTQGQAIEGRQVSMSKIAGIKDQAMRQRALGRVAIAEELQAKADLYAAQLQESQFRFGVAMDERGKLQQMMLQAPGAGIKFTDSYENAVGKINDWQQEEEEKARERAKKDAFDQMFMAEFGYDRGKLSRKEARKKLKKRMGSSKAYEKQMRDLEIAIKRKSLAKPYYKSSGSSSGGKNDDAEYKRFLSDTAKVRARIQSGETDWDSGWNYINTKYKGVDSTVIDNNIGQDLRSQSARWGKRK